MTSKAISICINRCIKSIDGRGPWQAEKDCYSSLVRTGTTPSIAANVAAAARRIGEWLEDSGMTITNVAFNIPGEPQGKGRARVGKINGHARMFTPAKTAAYESLVALAASQAMRDAGPFCGALAVEITATHTVPASWSKKRRHEAISGLLAPTCKPDIDNIVKAIADGGNGVVWVDDKQIVDLRAIKRYGETPGVHVMVAAC